MTQLPVALRAMSSASGVRRVLGAYAIYGLIEWSIWIAIILYAYDAGGARLAGLVAVAQLVPASLLTPAIASVGDRIPRGKALVAAYALVVLTTGATAVALIVEAPVPFVVVASAAATTCVAVVRPIHFATLPRLSEDAPTLVSANAMSSMADGLARFGGPVLAGIGAQLAGPWAVLSIATLAALTSMILCLRLRLGPGAPATAGEPEGWRAALQGVSLLARDGSALALLVVLTGAFVVGGAIDVLGVAFAQDTLGLGASGAGVVIGAAGIGAVVGAALAAFVSLRRRLAPIVLVGGIVQGVAVAAVAASIGLVPAVLLLAVSGIGGAVLMVSGRTLLQRTTDDRVLARVFAVQEGAALLGAAAGAAMAPLLVERMTATGAFAALGIGVTVVALSGFLLVRRLDARAVCHPREIELMLGIPFLSLLPPYELERLAGRAEWRSVAPDDVVLAQGDEADSFFIVDTGQYSVVVDGRERVAELTAGDPFGEIALMHRTVRTATVTARTSGRVLCIRADDFLAAVTGSRDGHAVAAEVAAAHLERDDHHR